MPADFDVERYTAQALALKETIAWFEREKGPYLIWSMFDGIKRWSI